MTRAPKRTPSVKGVMKMNDKAAERKVSMLIHNNFRHGDWHVVLTYILAPSELDAKRNIGNFQKRLARLYKRKGIILKTLTVTGIGRETGRIHHHIIIPGGIDTADIAKIWPHGRPYFSMLDDTGDYRALAKYLIDHNQDRFRAPDAVFRKRYTHSQNVVMPTIYKDEVSAKDIEAIKPDRGYEIDRSSIYEGYNPVTGAAYIEYVQVRIATEAPGRRRKKKTRERSLGHEKWLKENRPEQQELFSSGEILDSRK
jgi:hypothetical protein